MRPLMTSVRITRPLQKNCLQAQQPRQSKTNEAYSYAIICSKGLGNSTEPTWAPFSVPVRRDFGQNSWFYKCTGPGWPADKKAFQKPTYQTKNSLGRPLERPFRVQISVRASPQGGLRCSRSHCEYCAYWWTVNKFSIFAPLDRL